MDQTNHFVVETIVSHYDPRVYLGHRLFQFMEVSEDLVGNLLDFKGLFEDEHLGVSLAIRVFEDFHLYEFLWLFVFGVPLVNSDFLLFNLFLPGVGMLIE